MKLFASALASVLLMAFHAHTQLDADAVGRAAGTDATRQPDGVVRIGWVRTDVRVAVDGMPFTPQAGLGSWAAFKEVPGGAMVMGDTVVFQDEVDAAMDAAFANGLEITAIHNHFFYDEPKVYFMHIGGHAPATKLAAGVKAVWDAIKAVRADHPEPRSRFGGEIPALGTFDVEALESIIGAEGATNNGVVKFSIPREGKMDDVTIGGSMGLTSWAAFTGSDDLASIDGDLIMNGEEVGPALRALREADIHVVALHNHMIGGEPEYYFTHFWATGPAEELARGFTTAMNTTAIRR